MQNFWVTHEDEFAEWYIDFCCDGSEGSLMAWLNIAQGILDVGKELEVFSILETRSPHPYHATSSRSYLEHVVKVAQTTNELALLKLGFGAARTAQGQLRTGVMNRAGNRPQKLIPFLAFYIVEKPHNEPIIGPLAV